MKHLVWIIFAAIFFLFISVQYGTPAEFKLVGTPPFIEVTWKTDLEPGVPEPAAIKPEPKDIIIESLKTRQEIYKPGDEALVDFVIKNTLKVPYNLTVDWLFDNHRYHGWSNTSTEFHNITDVTNNWWSDYPLVEDNSGEWEIHLVISYELNNKMYTKDKTTLFRVI